MRELMSRTCRQLWIYRPAVSRGLVFLATLGAVTFVGASAGALLERLDWLLGTWQAQFLPHGPDRAAPTVTFEWGPNRAYLRMLGTQPGPDGRLVPEHETTIAWNPVAERLELYGFYPSDGSRMFETGHVEVLEDRAVVLHMDVHYAEGEVMPFSDRAVAGPGGHTLQFRRTLRADGDRGLRGTFFLKRGGRWENPHPELGMDSYPWTLVGGEDTAAMPDWARAHLQGMVRGSGRWIASNAEYMSADEPADAYGMEWQWTLGQQGLRGRLFGLRNGQEIGTYWEFRTYWHPGERRLVADQYGGNGTYGTGTITHRGDDEFEVDQTFYQPDGSTFRALHRTLHEPTRHVGSSFNWIEGEWQPRRSYTWELAEAGG